VFVANEILTAGEVNTNLMDQAVMVFADAAARTAALGSPSEGMVTYLEDTDSLELYTTSWGPVSPAITRADLPAGSVLQVVSVTKTDTYTLTDDTFTTVPSFSVSITPVSASSKVLVLANFTLGNTSDFRAAHGRLMRGSTSIYEGDVSGSRVRSSAGEDFTNTLGIINATPVFLDSPASASEVTYSLQVRAGIGGSVVFGRSGENSNDADGLAVPASITLMEVAG